MATLFDRLLLAESGNRQLDKNGNPITSPKGAIGAAQVMPTTAPEAARMAGVAFDDTRYRTDADYNKTLGKAYLDAQLKAFGGDEGKALAAYNAGAGRVKGAEAKAKASGGNWIDYMPEETKNYVAKINPAKSLTPKSLIDGFGKAMESSKPTGKSLVSGFAQFAKENPKEKGIIEQAGDAVSTAGRGALGLGETALTLGSAMAGAPIAGLSAIAQDITGTLPDGKTAEQLANERGAAMTYQPRTAEGQQSLGAIGEIMGNDVLQKLLPAVPVLAEFQGAGALGRAAAAPVVAGAAERAAPLVSKAQQAGTAATSAMGRVLDKTSAAAKGAKGKIAGAVKSDMPELPAGSVGAAATPKEVERAQTAAMLGYEGKAAPTAGQLSGDFEMQRFESEAAKSAGAANELLRKQTDAQNARSFQLLNDFEEEFNPTSTSQANRGEIVTGVLGKAEKADREAARQLYKQAEESGAMAGDVDIAPLEKYLVENRANAQKASILSNAESLLDKAKSFTKEEGGATGSVAVKGDTGYYRGANAPAGMFAWATKDKELANEYALGSGGKVASVVVDVKKPIDLGSDTRRLSSRSLFAEISEKADKTGIDRSEVMKARKEFLDYFGAEERDIFDYWKNAESQNITANLINAMGFDGIKLKEGIKGTDTIASTRGGVKEVGAGGGSLTIKQLEDLRSNIGKNTDWASPDSAYTPELKRIIDDILDNASVEAGGAYKAARSAWKGYKDKYANRELTAKLLGTKRGGIDRRVAMEDVFNQSVLKGKKEDLVHLMSVLGKSGDDGKQAINELRSGFIEHLRDKAFGNVSSVTAEGLPSISTAQAVKVVRELDKSGKLGVLFKTADAQKLRDFSEVVQMLNSKRYGAVNTSNTGSVMAALLESGASAMLSGVPIPVMTGIKEALRMKNERALAKAVQRSLDRHKEVLANSTNRF